MYKLNRNYCNVSHRPNKKHVNKINNFKFYFMQVWLVVKDNNYKNKTIENQINCFINDINDRKHFHKKLLIKCQRRTNKVLFCKNIPTMRTEIISPTTFSKVCNCKSLLQNPFFDDLLLWLFIICGLFKLPYFFEEDHFS